MPVRFFAATILGGRLHPNGIPDWGPWDSSRLEYFTESYIDPGLVGVAGDRKVRTKEELEASIREPMTVAPTRNVWIHESLADETRRLWAVGGTNGPDRQDNVYGPRWWGKRK